MSESVHSDNSPKAALAVAERYAGAVNYLYPLLINVSHKHRIVRDLLLSALFDQDRLIYAASWLQISTGTSWTAGCCTLLASPPLFATWTMWSLSATAARPWRCCKC